jgi:hypothetical protein
MFYAPKFSPTIAKIEPVTARNWLLVIEFEFHLLLSALDTKYPDKKAEQDRV